MKKITRPSNRILLYLTRASSIVLSAQPTSAYPAAQTAYVQPAHQTAYAAAAAPRAAQTYDSYQTTPAPGQYAYATRTQVQFSIQFCTSILCKTINCIILGDISTTTYIFIFPPPSLISHLPQVLTSEL